MKVVVVGAGVAGLAVSARLAAQGHTVTLCEASEQIGGKLGLVEHDRPEGTFRFDTGPSLVTLPHLLRNTFEATGGWPADLALTPLDPLARYTFADGSRLDASSDPNVFAERLNALRPGNGDEWQTFSARARRTFEASFQDFLASPAPGPLGLARLAVRRPRDVAAVAPGRSLRSVGDGFTDPRMRAWLDRYATYSGSDPRRAPAALTAVPYAEQAFGGWYVPGGLHRIGLALAARATELGVDVRLDARVASVEITAGRASGIWLADHTYLPAELVVSGVDARHLYDDLVHVPRATRRLDRATPSFSGFVLLLAVQGRTPGLAHHNVLFPADYDAEFDALFARRARPVADPTLYVSAPDDPAVRPDGHEAWFVLVNAPRHAAGPGPNGIGPAGSGPGGPGPGALDWTEPGLTDAYADRLLELLSERGLPVRDRVLWSQALSPADLERRTGAVGGAIYGTSSNGAAATFLRPANRSPLPGLMLVGGSAHPGGGLPLVLLSAQIVADAVGPA